MSQTDCPVHLDRRAACAVDLDRPQLQALVAQLQRFQLVVEHTDNMVVITDANKCIEYVNAAYTRVTGWSLEDIRGKKPGGVLQGPQTSQASIRRLSEALAAGLPIQDVEILNYKKNGETYWVSLNIQAVRTPAGDISHYVAIQSDVTERRQARLALEASERQLSQAQQLARIASFECVVSTDVMHWSRDAEALLGCQAQGLPQHYLDHVSRVHPDDRDALLDAHWQLITAHTPYEVEYRVVAEPSPPRWLRERGHHLPADTQYAERISGVVQDITDTKFAQARMAYLAQHDSLTGLPNRDQLRAALRNILADGVNPGTPFAVLFVDLDRFKVINDSLGHHVGDQVLKDVARRLRDGVRTSDVVCRLGGDEFVVVLVGTADAEAATRLASKLVKRLAQPMHCAGRELHLTASIGISRYPQDGACVEELMRHADIAMYQAKAKGRNAVCHYHPESNQGTEQRFDLESRLRAALPAGELLLHFQPQFSAATHRLLGFEALLRWTPREGPPVPPDVFIPVAEESGLIGLIGAWVLEQACRQWSDWRRVHGVSVRMAVNVSAHQLRPDHDLVGCIAALVRRHGIPPDTLELELTESVAMHDPAASVELMRQLRQLGVSLAVDDFGTGYSSLAYLKMLPIHRLKLDRSFVQNIETDANDKAICSATIALAHSLGLEVVAEGVETAEQQGFLQAQGCDVMQGYLLGRPVPAAQAEAWVKPLPDFAEPEPSNQERGP